MILSASQKKVLSGSNASKASLSVELSVLLPTSSALTKEGRREQKLPSFFFLHKRRNGILKNGNDEPKTPMKILRSQKWNWESQFAVSCSSTYKNSAQYGFSGRGRDFTTSSTKITGHWVLILPAPLIAHVFPDHTATSLSYGFAKLSEWNNITKWIHSKVIDKYHCKVLHEILYTY